jgi:hypothetical protein
MVWYVKKPVVLSSVKKNGFVGQKDRRPAGLLNLSPHPSCIPHLCPPAAVPRPSSATPGQRRLWSRILHRAPSTDPPRPSFCRWPPSRPRTCVTGGRRRGRASVLEHGSLAAGGRRRGRVLAQWSRRSGWRT